MRVKLVFSDWRNMGKAINLTENFVELSMGDFHSGTTFSGSIELSQENADELRAAMKLGYQPCWWMAEDEPLEDSPWDTGKRRGLK